MSEKSRYACNTESVVDIVTPNPPSVRSLNMKHVKSISLQMYVKKYCTESNTCCYRVYI